MTTDCFFPFSASIPPFGIMKANLQGNRFQDRPISVPPINMSEVCDVFSNKDLPLISVRQPSTVAIAYVV